MFLLHQISRDERYVWKKWDQTKFQNCGKSSKIYDEVGYSSDKNDFFKDFFFSALVGGVGRISDTRDSVVTVINWQVRNRLRYRIISEDILMTRETTGEVTLGLRKIGDSSIQRFSLVNVVYSAYKALKAIFILGKVVILPRLNAAAFFKERKNKKKKHYFKKRNVQVGSSSSVYWS